MPFPLIPIAAKIGSIVGGQIINKTIGSLFGKNPNLGLGDISESTYYSGNSMFPTKGQNMGLPGVGWRGSSPSDINILTGSIGLPGVGGTLSNSGSFSDMLKDWIKKPENILQLMELLAGIPGGMQEYKGGQLTNALIQANITRMAKDQQLKDAARKGLQMMLSVNPYSKKIPANLGSVFNY
jgi:hypothetical protein